MIKLILPVPDGLNTTKRSHWGAAHRQKNAYRELCWAEAVKQVMPKAEEDLPPKALLYATFYIRNLRDAVDNLPGGLKGVLDCLKVRQTGNVHWRNGLYTDKGYIIDDDPGHLELGGIAQHVERKNPRLELEIHEQAE